MAYSIVFRIIGGSFETGYEIEAEIRNNCEIIVTPSGRLPANTKITELYERIFPVQDDDPIQDSDPVLYANWGRRSIWGSREIVHGDGIEAIRASCINTSIELERNFQTWLRHADLENIQTSIAREIPIASEPIFILDAPYNVILQRLPWHKWGWLNQEFPNAEIVLSRNAFRANFIQNKRLRILGILGSEENNIDLRPDWEALETHLQNIADLVQPPLQQPDLHRLRREISKGCDVLFFAGHSDSDESSNNGRIKINQTTIISIDEIERELREAIRNGLTMILLNSCSGLGIASRLSRMGVPYIVVMREPIHNDVAVKFIEYCLLNLAAGNSLTRAVSIARNELRELEEKYICASWMPIIVQNREAPDYIPFPKNDLPPAPIGIWQQLWNQLSNIVTSFTQLPKWMKLFGLLIIGLIFVWVLHSINPPSLPPNITVPVVQESIGDRVLFKNDYQSESYESYLNDKKNIAQSFSTGDLRGAIDKAKDLKKYKFDDPEPIWTINNANVDLELKLNTLSQDKVITLPLISSDEKGSSTAREAPRGAVVAQTEINKNGTPRQHLKIKFRVILDNNDEKIAELVAKKIVSEKSKYPAVVGHFESDASLKAAPIYEQSHLVMVSPASSVTELTQGKNFIFRTVPKSNLMAETLAKRIVQTDKKRKIGFCYTPLKAATAFKTALTTEIKKLGGKVLDKECVVSEQSTKSQLDKIIQEMKNNLKADALVLYFHLNENYQRTGAQELAQAARDNNLSLYGNHGLDAQYTRNNFSSFNTIKIVTPRLGNLELAKNFTKKFKATYADKYEPTWRDMMAYDAVMAIAYGLDRSNGTSEGLKQILHADNFSIPGSSGPIKFNGQGDRYVTPSIVELKCNENNPCKFELILEKKLN
ncbi:ABC transporter substrate-binding protein [Chamaesiphon sp. VAR_48_metabat_403]|uniref:ABC transporter substrate-binding protein n=1 Tax=Chamaesiphon sp. VAR_48_metabat_403 TaxID=2964700 RepID=UPI00286DEEE6|nr:ABC transporter substrate-binding protein [Chamaesiphon sp. VAR_48_metabat_403]